MAASRLRAGHADGVGDGADAAHARARGGGLVGLGDLARALGGEGEGARSGMGRDAWRGVRRGVLVWTVARKPGLLVAVLAALTWEQWLPRFPSLSTVNTWVPQGAQILNIPQLAPVYFVVLCLGLIGWLVPAWSRWWLRAAAAVLVLMAMGARVPKVLEAREKQAEQFKDIFFAAPVRDLGLELAKQPRDMVVHWAVNGEVPGAMLSHELMFYSGQVVVGGGCDVAHDRSLNRRSVVISSRAEPLEVVALVSGSPLVAYDCEKPAPFPPMPTGLSVADGRAVLGRSASGARLEAMAVFVPQGSAVQELRIEEPGKASRTVPLRWLMPVNPAAPWNAAYVLTEPWADGAAIH